MHFKALALARFHLAVSVKVGKGRVHIVIRFAAQKLKRKALRRFTPPRFGRRNKARQGIETLRGKNLRIKLDFAGWRRQRPLEIRLKRLPVRIAMEGKGDMPQRFQIVERDVLHLRARRMSIGPDRQRLSNQTHLRIAKAFFFESHALRELAKQPDIVTRLARRLDGLLRKLHVVVAIRALHIGVFQKRRGRENVVGVVRCVRKEEVMDYGKQVGALHPAADRVMVRRHRGGI